MFMEQTPSEYIKKTREALGISQHKMGIALGLTAQSIFYWESGRSKPSALALDWCKTVMILIEKKPMIPWGEVLTSSSLSGAVLLALEGYQVSEGLPKIGDSIKEHPSEEPRDLLLDSLKSFLEQPNALRRSAHFSAWMVTPRGTNEISSNHTLLRGATQNDLRRGPMVWSPFAGLDPSSSQSWRESFSNEKRHRWTIHVCFASHGYERIPQGFVHPELEEVYVAIESLEKEMEQTSFILAVNRETFCCEIVAWVKTSYMMLERVCPKKLNPPNF